MAKWLMAQWLNGGMVMVERRSTIARLPLAVSHLQRHPAISHFAISHFHPAPSQQPS